MMNEELKARMLKYLDTLESVTKAGADTAAEQLPELAQQFVMWKLWSSLACVVSCSAMLFLLWRLAVKHCIPRAMKTSDPEFVMFIGSLPFLVVSVPACVGLCSCMMTFIKALVAPKLLVLEELAKLIGAAT